MRLPKFHDRTSLYLGGVVAFTLCGISIADMVMVWDFRFIHLYSAIVGLVLGVHCVDMIRYYEKHRIVKIEKTDTHRIITKE